MCGMLGFGRLTGVVTISDVRVARCSELVSGSRMHTRSGAVTRGDCGSCLEAPKRSRLLGPYRDPPIANRLASHRR